MDPNAAVLSADSSCFLVPDFLQKSELHCTDDGFMMSTCSVADILHAAGIESLSDESGHCLPCKYYYDDWYPFTLPGASVWGLLKMREQESDASQQIQADADTPGVTIPFLSFPIQTLELCLFDPSISHQAALRRELHRVTAQKGQSHHPALKAYFASPKSQAPYLIAKLFCQKIAGTAQNGRIPVPLRYAALRRKPHKLGAKRLPRFLAENNAAAGYTVCDGQFLYLKNPAALSAYEQLAILATHTGNVSFHSFAAEVVYHARFLVPLARIPVPLVGWSAYDSAIRADMSIAASSLETFAPFYAMGGALVRQQEKYHPLG